MIARRIASLLLSLSVFHLAVVRNVPACADQKDGPMPEMVGMEGGEHAAHAAVAADAAPQGGETPAPMHCCDAFTGCGMSGLVATSELDGEIITPFDRRPHEHVLDALPSFATAPEPPPPRA